MGRHSSLQCLTLKVVASRCFRTLETDHQRYNITPQKPSFLYKRHPEEFQILKSLRMCGGWNTFNSMSLAPYINNICMLHRILQLSWNFTSIQHKFNDFLCKTDTDWKRGCIFGSDVFYNSKDEFLLLICLLKSCAEQLTKCRHQVT